MTGSVEGWPRILLRLEGLLVLGVVAFLFFHGELQSVLGLSVPAIAVLFLAPDLSMLAYLAGPRVGAIAYNAAHSYLGPLALVAAGAVLKEGLAPPLALLWVGHIGLDRALGYGLKYASGFGDTHLGRIGRPSPRPEGSEEPRPEDRRPPA